jgi:hypothetical protein
LSAGGTIGISRIDHNRPDSASRLLEISAADRYRSRDYAVPREYGGSSRHFRTFDKREIGAAAGFDAGAG